MRISQYVGVDMHGSKCRKRWARIQDKYRKSLVGHIDTAGTSGGSAGTAGAGANGNGNSVNSGYGRVDSGGFSFAGARESEGEDDGEVYDELGDIGGGLDLDE